MLNGIFGEDDDFETVSATVSSSFARPTTRTYCKRVGLAFAGLYNQGATCYLNSLIQALYMTPEFRRGIYELDPQELVLSSTASHDKENTSSSETAANNVDDPDALSQLLSMGFEEKAIIRAIKRFPYDPDNMHRIEWLLSASAADETEAIAPENQTNEPCEASDFTGLFEGIVSNDEADASQSAEHKNKASTNKENMPQKKYRAIPWELQRLFARLQLLQTQAVSTEDLTANGFNWKSSDTIIQHDVHELNRVLFDAIERSLVGTKGEQLINELYRGTLDHYVICSCYSSNGEEHFFDITLRLQEANSVEESLNQYVTPELLEGSNKYYCERCQTKVNATLGVRFKSLPRILVLSLARFEYDVEEDTRVKNCKRFTFPPVLDMSPYCTEELKTSHEEKAYELFAVVIHRGNSAQYGHYFAYIKDVMQELSIAPQSTGISEDKESEVDGETPSFGPQAYEGWYCFNDNSVTPIWTSKIEKQFGGSSECAYMLIYRRKDLKQVTIPQPPPHMLDEVEAENAELEAEAIERENKKHSITFVLSESRDIELSYDPNGTRIMKRLPNSSRKLTIDNRLTLRDLKQKIIELIEQGLESENIQVDRCISRHDGVIQLGNCIIPKNADQSILDQVIMHIRDLNEGTELLVWDGIHVNGEKIDKEQVSQQLSIKVRFYTEVDKWDENTIVVRNSNMLVSDLIEHIKSTTKLEQTYFCRIDPTRVVALDLHQKLNSPVFEIFSSDLISGEVVISVEHAPVNNIEESLVYLHHQKRKSFVPLFVAFSPSEMAKSEPAVLNFELEKSTTLQELKSRVLKELIEKELIPDTNLREIGASNIYEHASKIIRLRRTLPGNSPGEVFQDDSITLKEAGILEYTRIIAERISELDENTESSLFVPVRFTFGRGRRRVESSSIWHINLCINWKISEAIDRMVEIAGLPKFEEEDSEKKKTYRLYSTDVMWESPSKIYDDVNCKIRHVVPSIEPDALLWLEEGPPPVLGAITLTVELCTLNTESSSFNAEDIFTCTPFVSLEISKHESLHSLRKSIFQALLESPQSDQLQLGLPRKQIDIEQGCKLLRLWARSSSFKLLKSEHMSLKKQHVDNDTVIAVQILNIPDPWLITHASPITNTGAEPLLLYLRERDSANKSFKPAAEFVYMKFSTGVDNEDPMEQFLGILAAHLQVPQECLIVAKALPQGRWKLLNSAKSTTGIGTSPDTNTNAGQPINDKRVKNAKKSATNPPVRTKKLWLQDGDVLVWKDSRSDPQNSDDFINKPPTKDKRSKKAGERSSSPTKRTRVPEVPLRIVVQL